ncbi:protein of unknown function [Agrobacterium pusense]|uniref:Uncharacterized protein n=1 Tax=Agrobacterium pusense TaxID=648995 RepID=U4PQI2_9HYPH|nr:protein of unknown function [Agrobacterium pusense]
MSHWSVPTGLESLQLFPANLCGTVFLSAVAFNITPRIAIAHFRRECFAWWTWTTMHHRPVYAWIAHVIRRLNA